MAWSQILSVDSANRMKPMAQSSLLCMYCWPTEVHITVELMVTGRWRTRALSASMGPLQASGLTHIAPEYGED